MRHFAIDLGELGFSILYRYSDLNYADTLLEIRIQESISSIHCMQIQEPEVSEQFKDCYWIQFHENNLYLSSAEDFREIFPEGSKKLHETFYRKMSIKYQILLEAPDNLQSEKTIAAKPLGGKWNLDFENRSTWRKSDPIPNLPKWISPESTTKEVMKLIDRLYSETFGDLESFGWPVTREQSLEWLEHFACHHLESFGRFEDAMSIEEPYLFHSLLSPLIHLGLLHPLEGVERTIQEYALRRDTIPLSSLEGFIRQIIGWREYMRHIFLENVEIYRSANFFHHDNPLPDLYWGTFLV